MEFLYMLFCVISGPIHYSSKVKKIYFWIGSFDFVFFIIDFEAIPFFA